MNTQPEATAAIAIALGQDLEHFEFADDMLTHDPGTGEDPIAVLVRFTHLSASGFLNRRATLGVTLLEPLIATIA